MARAAAVTGLLWCQFVLVQFSSGDVLHVPEELAQEATFIRTSNTGEDNTTWSHLQASVKRQAFLNSHSQNYKQPTKYGPNQFSHLSPHQFKDIYLRARPEVVPKYNSTRFGHLRSKPCPARFDWREYKAIGPVQDQGLCGGCWAFSVVAAIEAVEVKDGGTLQDLSVQQVIDCSYINAGCKGGSTVSTLKWLKQSKMKLVREKRYPYKAETKMCQIFPQSFGSASVKDYYAFDFSSQEELMMQWLVYAGPLVVIVDAVSWQDYLGGVIQHHCSSRHANHAVVIIGYDITGEVPFWIIRNSWGKSWGDGGYAYVKMGENMCGVADCVAVVVL
ncbi:cathepsin O isoform X1 [Astyanax mexicanus]|uniref:Cathepsin O n=1 Tax=Astyanax mexicanus TaxID=7994 RepID=A0A8T2LLP7_ASTMX|nr:cathepsin O isoform X1 [Astyanax mexicanus]